MKFFTAILAACLFGLAGCATDSELSLNDGIAESAPVGTNVKSTRTTYQRGGSSSSVKVLTRENLEDEGATADDVLKPD